MSTKLVADEYPHDLLAEKSFLGSLIIDNRSFDEVSDLNFSGEEFYNQNHAIIFVAIKELFMSGSSYDIVTLASKLTDQGKLERVGGQSFLIELCEHVGSSANVAAYGLIVKEKAVLREVMRASSRVFTAAGDFSGSLDTFLQDVESSFFKLTTQSKGNRMISIRESLFENLKDLESPARAPGEISGVTTGFRDLDQRFLGLQAGQMIIVAARPGMGKTALALNWAVAAAKQTNLPVAVFSYEMTHTELSMRLLASESCVDSRKLKKKDFNQLDLKNIGLATQKLSNLKLMVNDVGSTNLIDIRSYCRKLKAEQGLAMIVIDYLQLMPPHVKKQSREQEISEISRGIKMLAGELGVPIVALSQLNRSSEARTGKRPQLSDLRESGSLEQDANIVCLIHREDKASSIAKVLVEKNRNGEPGDVELNWIGSLTKFTDIEPKKI